jgi:hypothetical protein
VIIDAPNESGGCMEESGRKITVLKILIRKAMCFWPVSSFEEKTWHVHRGIGAKISLFLKKLMDVLYSFKNDRKLSSFV